VALTGWTTVARLVRAETLSLKARDFTRAAQALGAVPLRIMFRHILPNAAARCCRDTSQSARSFCSIDAVLPRAGHAAAAASWATC